MTADVVTAEADALLRQVAADPLGDFTPSVYETARLVAQAPWLPGHAERMTWLLHRQHANGLWGGPAGHAVIPSLSAVDALLTTRTGDSARAVDRGMHGLIRLLGEPRLTVPETPGADLIVPWLIDTVNERLARSAHPAISGIRLPMPAGFDMRLLRRLKEQADRSNLPDRLWHMLEVLGPQATGAAGVYPLDGAVSCSPAATLAWSGAKPDRRQLDYLTVVQARHGGPVPCSAPLDVFERAWVVCALLGAGIAVRPPASLAAELAAALSRDGAPGGAGLPPDADDTAVVLHALALLGRRVSAETLYMFDIGTHFACYHGESTPSPSTNAHVLDALGDHPPSTVHHADARRRISHWLAEQQAPDGHWDDKWHTSPYYATRACAVALTHNGVGPQAAEAVRSAVRWTLDTQHADGSWGIWSGTREETAYALQTLTQTTPDVEDPTVADAVVRGHLFLITTPAEPDPPQLWHDKDFYIPKAAVRAEELAAIMHAEAHLHPIYQH